METRASYILVGSFVLGLIAAAFALMIQHRLPPSGLVVLLSVGLLSVGGTGLIQTWFRTD